MKGVLGTMYTSIQHWQSLLGWGLTGEFTKNTVEQQKYMSFLSLFFWLYQSSIQTPFTSFKKTVIDSIKAKNDLAYCSQQRHLVFWPFFHQSFRDYKPVIAKAEQRDARSSRFGWTWIGIVVHEAQFTKLPRSTYSKYTLTMSLTSAILNKFQADRSLEALLHPSLPHLADWLNWGISIKEEYLCVGNAIPACFSSVLRFYKNALR